MNQVLYKEKPQSYFNKNRAFRILPFIPPGKHRILELGCATGILGKTLKEHKLVTELVGVEIVPSAAEEAKHIFDKIFIGDIESLPMDYDNYFDIIIAADVLEHLRDPWETVSKIHTWMKPGGRFISLIPNIRNLSIIANLLFKGEWNYSRAGGILDDTHLRFFTHKTFLGMLLKANFKIYHSSMVLYGRKGSLINKMFLGLLNEFVGQQVLAVAVK